MTMMTALMVTMMVNVDDEADGNVVVGLYFAFDMVWLSIFTGSECPIANSSL